MRQGRADSRAGGPAAMRAYLVVTLVAAVALPLLLHDAAAPQPQRPVGLTLALLLGIAALNVEMARALGGGAGTARQPHQALSAWAFACALLLPPPWLLVVVPVAFVHTRWRGPRVPLWTWVGSASSVLLSALAAGLVAHRVLGPRPDGANWMDGNGGLGLLAILAGAVCFLAAEAVLLLGGALLNHAEDGPWRRATLRSGWFYATELGVLVVGGLLCAVWTGGAWFVLLFVPIYMLSQRAALHETVSASNVALARDNRFKVDLMGMLGHEIGNPLTSVMGHAQVGTESLEEGDVDQAARSLAVVERNATQIRYVLHDVLTLVASDSGRLEARPERVDVAPAVAAAVASLPQGPRPIVEADPDAVALVQSTHLDQVLANLLSNARKYAGGADTVLVRVDDATVRVTVVDHGPGVAAELGERLFERFGRGEGEAPGTGLGLFISRQLARTNGGDLVHRPSEPTGATFELTLPRASVPDPSSDPAPDPARRPVP